IIATKRKTTTQTDAAKTIGKAGVAEMLGLVVETPTARAWLIQYLQTSPNYAHNGDQQMSRSAQRLLRLARAQGHDVVVPACTHCDRDLLLGANHPDGSRCCHGCYTKATPKICGRCHLPKIIRRRLEDGSAVCGTCWRKDPANYRLCTICDRMQPAHKRVDGHSVCENCADGRIGRCVHCHKTTTIAVSFLGGDTCESCYRHAKSTKKKCPTCYTSALLVAVDEAGNLVCSTCAGTPPRYACPRCGNEEPRYGRICHRCHATDCVNDLFAEGTARTRSLLAPLQVRLLDHPEPQSMAKWTKRSRTAALLRKMLREEIPISHTALDDHPAFQPANLLRHSLTDVGILKPRDEGGVRFERWLDAFLSDRPDSVARHLTPFCRWEVTARTRQLIRQKGITDGSYMRARLICRTAERFLNHLDQNGIDLGTAPQSVVEQYLDDNPKEASSLRNFLRWAARTGRARRLRPIKHPSGLKATSYPPDEHKKWLQRLSTDESLPLITRITGLISGLYGRPASHVLRLTRADIIDDGNTLQLRLGQTPITLPPPLPELIRSQIDAPRRWDTDSDWLFPSKLRAGAHVDYDRPVTSLEALGCSIVALRGSAMLNLASTMPIGPLCDLTGVAPSVARRWQIAAAAPYAKYPAMRQPARP
ncbi:hypothetical protein V8Z69_17110, partial (plasmid) [Microbacterium aurugineum]|uniref:hypothetical protein n=3 Tax=Microbacterium TaxID=33882 RepID=UPI0039BECFD6